MIYLIARLLFFLPMLFSFFFISEFVSNLTLAYFLTFFFIIIYLISFLATITLIILKIVNLKLKSNKIRKINKILFIFFCVFIIAYISTIGMACISRYVNLKKYGEKPEMEHVGNFNYGATGKAAGFSDAELKIAAGGYQLISGTSDSSFISSYFDDPRDMEQIENGIEWYDNN